VLYTVSEKKVYGIFDISLTNLNIGPKFIIFGTNCPEYLFD